MSEFELEIAKITIDTINRSNRFTVVVGEEDLGFRIRFFIRDGFNKCSNKQLSKLSYAKQLFLLDHNLHHHIKAAVDIGWPEAFKICDTIDKLLLLS